MKLKISICVVAVIVVFGANLLAQTTTSVQPGMPSVGQLELTRATQPKSKDRVAQFNSATRWFKRGATIADEVTTWRMLSVPGGNGVPVRYMDGRTNPIVGYLPSLPELPREGGLGKHFGGDRNRYTVVGYVAAEQILTEFASDKLFRYLSKRNDRWRHLRILIPLARTYFGAQQIRAAFSNEAARGRYVEKYLWLTGGRS